MNWFYRRQKRHFAAESCEMVHMKLSMLFVPAAFGALLVLERFGGLVAFVCPRFINPQMFPLVCRCGTFFL